VKERRNGREEGRQRQKERDRKVGRGRQRNREINGEREWKGGEGDTDKQEKERERGNWGVGKGWSEEIYMNRVGGWGSERIHTIWNNIHRMHIFTSFGESTCKIFLYLCIEHFCLNVCM